MKKKFLQPLALIMGASICLCGCGGIESVARIEGAVEIKAKLSEIVDPPLLKKIAMYNAGCIQPLTNYDRDFSRIKDLNSDALRIDLSIGKDNGTAGEYLVGDEYEDYGDYDKGTYGIVPESLNYNFDQLDGIVKLMNGYGVLPYMSWDYIPAPLMENGKWNNLDTMVTNWKEVWEEVYYQYAYHYLEEEFINGKKDMRIGYHEIYNEPDLEILKCWGVFDPENFDGFLNWNDFCLGAQCKPGDGVYPDMYEYGAKGIARAYEEFRAKGYNVEPTIGGPAFALGEIGVEDWVGVIPRVKKENLPMDFYSFHTYLDGDTWFRTDATRQSGGGNEMEKVVAGLANDPYFLKTAIHINEFSYLNDKNGSNEGLNSPFNYYGGAWRTIDGLMEAVNRTSVQWAYWAQFMESTGGYDPYGMIEKDNGNVKAAYNAMKIYMDMPVWRYNVTIDGKQSMHDLMPDGNTAQFDYGESGLQSIVSSDGDKIGILIWNTNSATDASGLKSTAGDREVNVSLEDAAFETGQRTVYRIDGNHASYFDNENKTELEAQDSAWISTQGIVWSGSVPADGVVYITVNKDKNAKDFSEWDNRVEFADDVKTQYYYEDRYRQLDGSHETYEDNKKGVTGSYSHFDRTNWTMYLGMGDSAGKNGQYKGQAHANGVILVNGLPTQFKVNVKTEGKIELWDENETLGFRVDFIVGDGEYVKSVYFYLNDLYLSERNPNAQDVVLKKLPVYPWGTQKKPDAVKSMTGEEWNIDLSEYAPDGWNGSAQISFDMQNCGAGTRAMFSLSK